MAELLIEEKLAYVIADKEFYEPLARYKEKQSDYCDPLRRHMPPGWELQRSTVWCYCSPAVQDIPAQGWKIHVSTTPAHAAAILVTVARILFQTGTSFKFIADRALLMLTNGKQWGRGGSGKFITIYPRNTEFCGELLERLREAMTSYRGPYILSDRRYRDSTVLYYRYGGIAPNKRIDVDGRPVYVFQGADGSYVDDERSPYFKLPDGIEDPFAAKDDALEASPDAAGETGTLKAGRYKIESVLNYTNTGGVYLALDRQTDTRVVVKEARPYTNISLRGLDSVQLLKKEHRLLDLLADSGFTPEPVDFFMDWEHAYLVEKYLADSITLRMFFSGISPAIRTRFDRDYVQGYFKKYCEVFTRVVRIIKHLHESNIVFSDLSVNNILVQDGGEKISLIDFEGAYEEDVDIPPTLFTQGFAPQNVEMGHQSRRGDDYYALGGLMLAALFPMNSLFSLNREAHRSYLAAFKSDFGLPDAIADVIDRLLRQNAEERPSHEEIIDVLARPLDIAVPARAASDAHEAELGGRIEEMLRYTESVADFERIDRLFPADPAVFETNPLSIAHGACGVAYVMHKVRGAMPERVREWINRGLKDYAAYPPGLYMGLSGIAWILLETGQPEQGREMLAHTQDHRLLWRAPDLFNGAAGWGLAQLRFYLATRDDAYLANAVRAGDFLLESAEYEADGNVFWQGTEGSSASLGHGNAGVCLYLLYLYQASGRLAYLDAGKKGMAWVLDKAIRTKDGGISWTPRASIPSYTPYWRWGSSGIGRVLLRYWHVTGEARYEDSLRDIHIDCDRKYAIFPGYFFGLTGIAEFYLDLARFPSWEQAANESVRRILEGSLLFAMPRDAGLAMPGESLSRISCDFGTGSAGAALVMHRYLTRCGASFMLDELLPGWAREDRATGLDRSRQATALCELA